MDIFISLLAYHGYTVIIVNVVCFPKAAPFGMLHIKLLVFKVVELFTNILCKLHDYHKASFL